MTKILEGVRVLELGQVLAGPFAGAILADMGASLAVVFNGMRLLRSSEDIKPHGH